MYLNAILANFLRLWLHISQAEVLEVRFSPIFFVNEIGMYNYSVDRIAFINAIFLLVFLFNRSFFAPPAVRSVAHFCRRKGSQLHFNFKTLYQQMYQ